MNPTLALPADCPTCGAALKGLDRCRRCKTDLRPLAGMLDGCRDSLAAAQRALSKGDFEEAFLQARRACGLRRSAQGLRRLACAALLTGRFDMALFLWAKQAAAAGPGALWISPGTGRRR